jgi:membrane fusion protein, peptide pheromone/bacteriocin exporter
MLPPYISSLPTYPRTNFIYLVSIVSCLAAVFSLPYLKTNVSVRASAIIRPTTQLSIVKSLVNGKLKETYALENKFVVKGEILFVVESELTLEKERQLVEKAAEVNRFITDYRLVLGASVNVSALNTPLLQQAFTNYNQRLFEATTHLNKVTADYRRNLKLHNERVIADSEFENFQFELDKAKNNLELVKQNQLSQWQNELRNYEKELVELNGQLGQLQKEKENLIIKAPVSGNLQNVAGLYAGSLVFANQDLAQISPDTSLLVEAYINPNDIGLLRNEMLVRFQVDAFNYNQWGMATGRVLEISNDIYTLQDKPVFKVKCVLDKDYLQLKNGYKGFLKKGMTLQARFMITERTLWQLLYDKVDDWVNPNTFVK